MYREVVHLPRYTGKLYREASILLLGTWEAIQGGIEPVYDRTVDIAQKEAISLL